MSDQPKREDWRAWCAPHAPGTRRLTDGSAVPDPEMQTREELIARLERWGVPGVNERNLRHWEGESLLPRATIEGPPGKQRAMYPWWSAELVALLRQEQSDGYPTGQIIDRMRYEAHRLSRMASRRGLRDDTGPMSPIPTLMGARPLPSGAENVTGPFVPALLDLIDIHREVLGINVAALDIVMTTEHGGQIVYNVFPGRESDTGGTQ